MKEEMNITLKNPLRHDAPLLSFDARVDENLVQMQIPASIAMQLGFQQIEKRNGIPYVGVHVKHNGRSFFTGALVMGDEVILGRLILTEMEDVIAMMEEKIKQKVV